MNSPFRMSVLNRIETSSPDGIDLNAMRRAVPSVFAVEKHHERSERYTYIPTVAVVEALMKEGFVPMSAMQSRARTADRREFTKHMIRLRAPGKPIGKNGEFGEVLLLNSHDGTSSYHLRAGVFRMVCSNGLVVGDTFNSIKIPHKGNIVNQVIEGTYTVVDQFAEINDNVERLKSIELTAPEQQLLAKSALQLRYEDRDAPITTTQALTARRWDDRAPDLWTTFNRIQENLVRGGQRGLSGGANGNAVRRVTTRELTGVDSLVGFNKALWDLTQGMAALKEAA